MKLIFKQVHRDVAGSENLANSVDCLKWTNIKSHTLILL